MAAALYLCLHLRDFAAQAMECASPHLPETGRCGGPQPELRRRPLAILSGTPPLEYVFAVNRQARELGVDRGMSRMQAESFGVEIRRRDRALEEQAFAHLVESAGRFSPRIEIISAPHRGPQRAGSWLAGVEEHSSEATLVLDIASSSRLLGTPEQIAKAIACEVRAAGLEASVAVSHNASAALLAARGNSGITIIPPGHEAQTLAPLPLSVLQPAEEQGPQRAGSWLTEVEAQTLASWGIRTLGQLAALPSRSLAARLGQSGVALQAQARGESDHLLVPTEEPPDAPLCAALELEHPVELLEPLLFLLNQLLQQVLDAAQQRALAIASLELYLCSENKGGPHLPSVGKCGDREDGEDCRTIRPALPERDHRVLLKLIQLELELRPPSAAVIALRMVAHPARVQRAQQGLFAAQAPEPGRMAVLLARLRKLVGEGRAGSPELLDSRALDAFRMAAFSPDNTENHSADVKSTGKKTAGAPFKPGVPCKPVVGLLGWKPSVGLSGVVASPHHSPALRMLRPPREVSIELCHGAPAAMHFEGQRRKVQASSGPWRTSEWWTHPGWCREEWEVIVHDAAIPNKQLQNETVRLAHDPANGGWYVIGIYD